MSEHASGEEKPEPLDRAIEQLRTLDGDIRTEASESYREFGKWTLKDLQERTDHIHTLLERQDELDDQKGIRETVRDSVDSVRRLTPGESPPTRKAAARDILAFYEAVIDTWELTDAVLDAHRGLVFRMGKTLRDLETLWTLDAELLAEANTVARGNEQAVSWLADRRTELAERLTALAPAVAQVEMTVADSIDAYLILDDNSFRQLALLVNMTTSVTSGLLDVFGGYTAHENGEWGQAQRQFETAYETFLDARATYERARELTADEQTPVEAIFGTDWSAESEQAAIDYAESVLEIVDDLASAAGRVASGDEAAGKQLFETQIESITELSR